MSCGCGASSRSTATAVRGSWGRGSHRVPLRPGQPRKRGSRDTEPGARGHPLPLPRRARAGPALADRDRPREEAAPAAHGADGRGGAIGPFPDRRPPWADGAAHVRHGHEDLRVRGAPRQGHRPRTPRDRRPPGKGRQGSRHYAAGQPPRAHEGAARAFADDLRGGPARRRPWRRASLRARRKHPGAGRMWGGTGPFRRTTSPSIRARA